MEPTRTSRLAARVAIALAEPEPDALDALLTDCVAEGLSIRAGILGRQRLLEGLIAGAITDAAASEEISSLATRNRRAWQEWRELSELIAKVRARRNSLAEPAHQSAQPPETC